MSCFGADEPRHRLMRLGVGMEGCYTWEVPALVWLLGAILPKNGATYVSTNPQYFDRPWLGAEIKAKCLTPH